MLIAWITRLLIRLIRGGLEDENIKKEYYKKQCGCGGECVSEIFDKIFSIVFCAIFVVVFIFSLSLSLSEEKKVGDIPVMRVVQSGSMSKKYERNEYLFANNLNDQIQTFDIIVTEKLPDEFALKVYDIVVYEVDDTLVVHRIIKIEEPNEKHPDCRWFTLQGDNVQYPDKTPVLYSQMIAIYNGNRIPYVGSFIAFMQSPAGWLCMILLVGGSIAIPIVEGILRREREKRLIAIGELPEMGKFFGEWEKEKAAAHAEQSATPTLTVMEESSLEPQLIEKLTDETAEEVADEFTDELIDETTDEPIETLAEEIAQETISEPVEEFVNEFESETAELSTSEPSNELIGLRADEVVERVEDDGIEELPMPESEEFSVTELLRQGYKVKGISVRLVKKLEVFKDSKASLVKFIRTRNGIKMYFAYTPKEEVENDYVSADTRYSKNSKEKPLSLKISFVRGKGDKK